MGGSWFSRLFFFFISVVLTLLFIPSFPPPPHFWVCVAAGLDKLLLNKLITRRRGPEREREKEREEGVWGGEVGLLGREIFLSARVAIK